MKNHEEEPDPVEQINDWTPIETKTSDTTPDAGTNLPASGTTSNADTTTQLFSVTIPENSVFQIFRRQSRNHKIPVEQVNDWIEVSNTLNQHEIAWTFINLYVIAFIVGLVQFTFTQNIWLLAMCSLPLLIRWIIGFFFRRPKK